MASGSIILAAQQSNARMRMQFDNIYSSTDRKTISCPVLKMAGAHLQSHGLNGNTVN